MVMYGGGEWLNCGEDWGRGMVQWYLGVNGGEDVKEKNKV